MNNPANTPDDTTAGQPTVSRNGDSNTDNDDVYHDSNSAGLTRPLEYKIIYNPMPKLRPEWIEANEKRRKELWGDWYVPVPYPPEMLP